MTALWIALGIIIFLLLAVLITAYVCFFRIFYYPPRRRKGGSLKSLPYGDIFAPYKEEMADWIQRAGELPCKEVSVTAFDGLTLRGRYFEYAPGAPIELLMHGYKGNSVRDLSGGIFRCFALGRNALLVDHRSAGNSEGNVITFGVNESRDCQTWANFIVREIDPGARIILTGISMGAATVLTAAGYDLPGNVVGVLADCGYTSSAAIIKKVIRDMKLPADLLYPFARLGARLFGGFDPDERSAVSSMKRCKLPVIFIHGDGDNFVPAEMSRENYDACTAEKRLVIIPGAGHGLCFPADRERYLKEVQEFFEPYL